MYNFIPVPSKSCRWITKDATTIRANVCTSLNRDRAKFIFRAPLLSTVSNIFTLPFQRSVWIAIGVFLLLVLGLLYFSSKWEYRRGASAKSAAYWQQFHLDEQTLSDNFMVVLGAFAQQGKFALVPKYWNNVTRDSNFYGIR